MTLYAEPVPVRMLPFYASSIAAHWSGCTYQSARAQNQAPRGEVKLYLIPSLNLGLQEVPTKRPVTTWE